MGSEHSRQHFSHRAFPPMQFHFQTDESQEIITSFLSGYDLHNLGPSFKFLVQTLDDVCCPKRYPFLWGIFKNVRQQSMELAKHLTAEGMSLSHLSLKAWNNSLAFYKDGA